jgi:hypothetical protein
MMKRWKQIYLELKQKADELGYSAPVPLGSGNSQSYEFQIDNQPALLVAFRDVGLKPNYSKPDRLWVEGLDLVLDRYTYTTLAKDKRARTLPSFAIVSDNIRNAYVVVSLNNLFELYLHRIHSNPDPNSRKFTFVVIHRQQGYLLQMPREKSEVALTTVNSLATVVSQLKSLWDKARS